MVKTAVEISRLSNRDSLPFRQQAAPLWAEKPHFTLSDVFALLSVCRAIHNQQLWPVRKTYSRIDAFPRILYFKKK